MTRSRDAAETDVVRWRVRNRIVDYLTLAASELAQRKYQAEVPLVHVPSEVINQWEDWVPDAPIGPWFDGPVYTDDERVALGAFHAVWDAVADGTPNPLPALEETLRLPEWTRLREAAEAALAVFRVRGAFFEYDRQ